MQVKFCKMHGLGNDFVVIEALRQQVRLTPPLIRKIANRHLGIGCDQLLLIEPPSHQDLDFDFRYFNSDGSEVEQCGNGIRCMARFLYDEKLIGKSSLKVRSKKGILKIAINHDKSITVNMGIPQLNPADIPFRAPEQAISYPIDIQGEQYEISALSMGNPHAVVQVKDIKNTDVAGIGARLENHPRFTNKTNVGFMQVDNRQKISLRVFERGVGETLSCGTGACAAAASGIQKKILDTPVLVSMRGGTLSVDWAGEGKTLRMTGPAVKVFSGHIKI